MPIQNDTIVLIVLNFVILNLPLFTKMFITEKYSPEYILIIMKGVNINYLHTNFSIFLLSIFALISVLTQLLFFNNIFCTINGKTRCFRQFLHLTFIFIAFESRELEFCMLNVGLNVMLQKTQYIYNPTLNGYEPERKFFKNLYLLLTQ